MNRLLLIVLACPAIWSCSEAQSEAESEGPPGTVRVQGKLEGSPAEHRGVSEDALVFDAGTETPQGTEAAGFVVKREKTAFTIELDAGGELTVTILNPSEAIAERLQEASERECLVRFRYLLAGELNVLSGTARDMTLSDCKP